MSMLGNVGVSSVNKLSDINITAYFTEYFHLRRCLFTSFVSSKYCFL